MGIGDFRNWDRGMISGYRILNLYQMEINMNTARIREKFYDYIRTTNDKKVKAIYTMAEEDVKPQANSPVPPAANAKMAKVPQQATMKSLGKLVHQVILLDITGREAVRKVIAPTSTDTLNLSEVRQEYTS